MKILHISDTHGNPYVYHLILEHMKDCDVIVHSGDIMSSGYDMSDIDFFNEFIEIVNKPVIYTPGNHDRLIQKQPELVNCHVLIDETLTIDGVTFYGFPWTLKYNRWSFQLDKVNLESKINAIQDCDVIISHSPPKGILDSAWGKNLGIDMNNKIKKIKPKAVLFGHIHEHAMKTEIIDGVLYSNGSVLNEHYTTVDMSGLQVIEV